MTGWAGHDEGMKSPPDVQAPKAHAPAGQVRGGARRLLGRGGGCWVLVLLLGVCLLRADTGGQPPPPDQARVRVGVLTDNYPFSYTGSDGVVRGYVVELLGAVEHTMGLQLERVVGPTGEINPAFRAGQLDMLQSYARFPERSDHAAFTEPYLTMAGSLFVRRGETRIRTLTDLRGRHVLVHRGSLGERLLHAAGLAEAIVLVDSVEESFRRLARGEGDAVLAGRLSGLATMEHLQLADLRAVGPPVEGYTVEYCFAVRRGDDHLRNRLNEGLAILQRNGEAERIYDRWFGRFDDTPFDRQDIALALAGGLAVALGIALWAWWRQRGLHRRLATKTAALATSEQRYRRVFEASLDGLLVVAPVANGADYQVEHANPAARRLFGDAVGAAGSTLRTALPPAEELVRRIGRGGAGGEPSVFEQALNLPTGQLWLHVAVAPFDGRLLLICGDITAAKTAEARLRQIENQQRQTQKLEAIGTLASGIAHDFNNILTGIVGNAELARFELPAGSPMAPFLDEVVGGAARATALVRQILTFSRQGGPRREAMPLTPVVKEMLRFLRAVTPANIEIRHQFARDLPAVVCDPTQLHQVLLNLCTNAIYAMRDHGGRLEVVEARVEVGAELVEVHPQLHPGPHLRISVSDTGCGMPPEVLQRLFEPFFTTKPVGEGTGLGLSVVHGILHDHGGAITVYSTPGEGTVFHLYLPIAPVEGAAPAADEAPVPQGAGQRLLFVDDERAIANVAAGILRHLGYEVAVFCAPAEALAAFRAAPDEFALVFTDLAMPGLDGLALAAEVHALRPALPVVLASGFMNDKTQARARELGITHLVEKPLTFALLGRIVARALSR